MNLWKLFVVLVAVLPLSLFSYRRSIGLLLDTPEEDAVLKLKNVRDFKSLGYAANNSNVQGRNLPLFVLHVGPRNTGATAVQWFAAENKEKLAKDNFFFLGHHNSSGSRPRGDTHQLYLDCVILMQDYDRKFCERTWDNFERVLEKHRSKKHNVFVSDELFSSFTYTHQKHLWNKLVHCLEKKWRVRIIYSYRRYYASIHTGYTEFFNPESWENGEMVEMWPKLTGRSIPSFPEFFAAVEKDSFKYPTVVKESWEERFDVVVFNLHDNEEDCIENFVCKMLPEASGTCKFIKSQNNSWWGIPRTHSVVHQYEMLVVAAYRRGWVSSSYSPFEVTKAVESYAKKHRYEKAKVPSKCLSPTNRELLLKMSLFMEQKIVPNFYASPMGEDMLRSDFREASDAGFFCSVDTDEILKDDGWKRVFEAFDSAPAPMTMTDGMVVETEAETGSNSSYFPIDYPQLDVEISWLTIGAQGAGTTWLVNMLRECCTTVLGFPSNKEVHFWDWYRQKGLGWYSRQWDATGQSPKLFHGEITPYYMSLPNDDIREIRSLFPNVRIIFLARDLVDRTWSGLRKALRRKVRHGQESSLAPDNYTDDYFLSQVEKKSKMERSSYAIGLKRWYSHFPAEQILISNFDDISNDPSGLLRNVLNHIGVRIPDPYLKKIEEKEGEKINAGLYTDIRPSLRQKLEDIFRPHSKAFNALLREHGYNWSLNEYEQ